MASAKDDVSTKILEYVKSFIDDVNSAWEGKQAARAKEIAAKPVLKPLPDLVLILDKSATTACRTPAQQAAEVAAGRSWVCWGSHMADKARHVLVKINGKVTYDPKKGLGKDFDTFKAVWNNCMKLNDLKNFKGRDGWGEGDAYHLELADSKMPHSDARAQACMEEYVRLTRQPGKSKNEKFEKAYGKELAPFIKKLEKKP